MKYPAARGHPLNIPCPQLSLVAQAVSVSNGAGKDIGDRLYPSMRMPGKSGEVCSRVIVPKIVEQKERIEGIRISESKCTAEVDPRPFNGWLRFNNSFYRSDRHCSSFPGFRPGGAELWYGSPAFKNVR